MLQLLAEPWILLRDFFEAGGPVLYAVLFVAVLMWTLILERFWYLRRVHPARMQDAVARWQARVDIDSWFARRIREAMISRVSLQLKSSLGLIRTLIAVCPFLGLLGTVTGMIGVFDVMATAGTGSARGMAEGIYRATIPTMSGLVIALSGLFFSARLDQRTKEESEKLTDLLRHY